MGGYSVLLFPFPRLFNFCYIFVLFLLFKKRTIMKLIVFCVVLLRFCRAVEGIPHLKNKKGIKRAVSPPSSTKKINIDFGWGGYVGR